MSFISNVCLELKKLGVKVPKDKILSSFSKQEKRQCPSKAKYFGVTLSNQELIQENDFFLPRFLVLITTYLTPYMQNVGLFRKAGSVSRQRDLRKKLENGGNLDGAEPNDAATLLKQWLRELPEPTVPHYLQNVFVRCQNLGSEENQGTALLLSCFLLPPSHFETLRHLLNFLSRVASNSKVNNMGAENLALIMAPNIFVQVNKCANKNDNNLFQVHASIVGFLIKNADKVGHLPSGIVFQPKDSTDMDSSWDLLDCSPSWSRKKYRSGGVPDIFSGFKKFVGSSMAGVKTPEGFWDSSHRSMRSSQKHKRDVEEVFIPNKRQAVSNVEDLSECATPKKQDNHNDCLNVNVKNDSGHSRRKSFGILRKKRHKTISKSPVNKENIQKDKSPKLAESYSSDRGSLVLAKSEFYSPAVLNISHSITRSESIKKSASDSLLRPVKQECIRLSTSQSCLGDLSVCAPASLTQGFDSLYAEIQKTLEMRERLKNVDLLTDKKSDVICSDALFSKCKSPSSELSIESHENNEYSTDGSSVMPPKNEKTLERTAFRRSSRNSNRLRASTRNKNKVPIDATDIKESSILESPESDSDILKQRGIKRQDGFIMKSIRIKPNQEKKAQNLESTRVIRSKSVVSSFEKSEHKASRKSSRKGSIIRGRPNSIKSGLNSEACQRYSNTPSKVIIHDASENKENTIPTLSSQFDNMYLSSPVLNIESSNEIEVGLSNTLLIKSTPQKEELAFEVEGKSNTDLSSEKDCKHSRNLSNSDSKIPRLRPRTVSEIERTNSFNENGLTIINLNRLSGKHSDNGSSGNISKIPIRTPPMTLRSSVDSDVFKTPSTGKASPKWISASKFFESPISSDLETQNKRESIAMILKKNPGHVQAKVSLYDNIAKVKVTGTHSLSAASTPVRENVMRTYSEAQCSKSTFSSDFKRATGPRSSIKKRGQRINSPFPPPPKFVITDTSTPSPQLLKNLSENEAENKLALSIKSSIDNFSPKVGSHVKDEISKHSPRKSLALKEVTNFSSLPEEYSIKDVASKNLNDLSMGEENFQMSSESKRNCVKRKNNSFSEKTPLKISKRVLRSESSPMFTRSRALSMYKKSESHLEISQSSPKSSVTFHILESRSPIEASDLEIKDGLAMLRFNYS